MLHQEKARQQPALSRALTSHECIQGVLVLPPLGCRGAAAAPCTRRAVRNRGRLLFLNQLLQPLPLLLERLFLAAERGSILNLKQGGRGLGAPRMAWSTCKNPDPSVSFALGGLPCLPAYLHPAQVPLSNLGAPPASGPPCPSCCRRQRPPVHPWRCDHRRSHRRCCLQAKGEERQQYMEQTPMPAPSGSGTHGHAAEQATTYSRCKACGPVQHGRWEVAPAHHRTRHPSRAAASSSASSLPSPPPHAAARWRPCRAGEGW